MTYRAQRLEIALFLLILVIGAGLRLVALDSVPPGLTHDEADHGVDAEGILEGRTPIYFTVGYGREPLFDYVTALVMLAAGRTFLASRITAALFGIGLMALVYGWVRHSTQNQWLALATMAGLAVSFWGVSTSRQALRSVTLPVLYMAAALAMRRGIRVAEDAPKPPADERPKAEIDRVWWFILAGLFLGLSIYTYLAARLMWLAFPAFFALLAITQPGVIRKAWPGLAVMLLAAAIVAAPLVAYLMQHPSAEVRISQLSGPIASLLSGNAEPLRQNLRAGLGMITIRGDDLWLYNIPGRPLLGPITSLLFYLGITIAVLSIFYPYFPARRGRASYDEAFRISSSNGFMLLTLVFGLIPAVITGVGASNTRVIGMQPALYYFPALAIMWTARWAYRQVGSEGSTAVWTTYGIMIIIGALITAYSYFGVWANARDVRVAYHTTLLETLHYLDRHPEIGPAVALSTITPGRFHDPAIAQMVLRRDDLNLRWFDGRSSFVMPQVDIASPVTYIFPEIARLDSFFQRILRRRGYENETILLRPGDFNRTVQVITWGNPVSFSAGFINEDIRVGDVLTLRTWVIEPEGPVRPGDEVRVVTWWIIDRRTSDELVLFTQALDGSSQVVAQQDLLTVPTSAWVSGDWFGQLHRFTIPTDTPSGPLRLIVGAYRLPDIVRLPMTSKDGQALGDNFTIGVIELTAP